MVKNSEQSINSQQKLATKDTVIAFLILLAFALILGLSSSISGYDVDKQSDLSARCRSIGGQIGNDKCFKDGREFR